MQWLRGTCHRTPENRDVPCKSEQLATLVVTICDVTMTVSAIRDIAQTKQAYENFLPTNKIRSYISLVCFGLFLFLVLLSEPTLLSFIQSHPTVISYNVILFGIISKFHFSFLVSFALKWNTIERNIQHLYLLAKRNRIIQFEIQTHICLEQVFPYRVQLH